MPKSALWPSLQKDGKLLEVIKKPLVVLSINFRDVFHEDMEEYRRVVAAIVFEVTGRTCTGISSGPGVLSAKLEDGHQPIKRKFATNYAWIVQIPRTRFPQC